MCSAFGFGSRGSTRGGDPTVIGYPFRDVVWYDMIFWEANTFRHAEKQKIALWRSGSSIRTMLVGDFSCSPALPRDQHASPHLGTSSCWVLRTVDVSVNPCTVGCVGRVVYGRVSKPPQARGAETRNTYLPTDTLSSVGLSQQICMVTAHRRESGHVSMCHSGCTIEIRGFAVRIVWYLSFVCAFELGRAVLRGASLNCTRVTTESVDHLRMEKQQILTIGI